GVDCFKTDFGERIPTDVQWFDGSDPQKMHNHYAYIYNELVWNMDAERMHRAAQCLLGENDFTSFRAVQCQSRTPWRNVMHINVTR
ncbi:hypothetical protein MJN76_30650, partial [Salmonella enterica subsp. enterica serovar Anatum]|nr:hypothetical protein [Salmonella enterica subsp. enterica serovar Anatum]